MSTILTGKRLVDDIGRADTAPLSFWWLGQLGYAVRAGGVRMYLDAYLSPNPRRTHGPICEAREVTNAGYFFGTHDHSDHIDRPVWPELAAASPRAKFVVPRALCDGLARDLGIPAERFLPVSDGETVRDGEIEITGVAAAHEFLDRDPASGEYPYMGYIVRVPAAGCAFYHSGDTCLYEGLETKLRAAGRLDAVFLPINGRDAARLRRGCIGNMTYQEAADLFGALRPGLCVPGHYELFPDNSQDPLAFCDYLDAKYPGLPAWVGPFGVRVDVTQ